MLNSSRNSIVEAVLSTNHSVLRESSRRKSKMVDPIGAGLVALAAAIAVSTTGIAAALGEQVIGSAAIGVMAEDEGFFGRGLVMTVIPESIVIFGLVVALILLFVTLPSIG